MRPFWGIRETRQCDTNWAICHATRATWLDDDRSASDMVPIFLRRTCQFGFRWKVVDWKALLRYLHQRKLTMSW